VSTPATVKRNEAGSGFARSRRIDEGETGREWEAEELRSCTPANSGHGGQQRSKAGHSGYPKNSGRVIRVVRNSGIKNCYPIFVPKKHYPKFRVPDNSGSGSGFSRYTRNWQNQPFWKNSSTILKQ
jgi:hypothetical protein